MTADGVGGQSVIARQSSLSKELEHMGKDIKWQRMKSTRELKPENQIRGFFPFSAGNVLVGRLEEVKVKPDGSGFYIIRLEEPCVCNVKDESIKTGQATIEAGSLVGLRKTGSTARIAKLPIGTLFQFTFLGIETKTIKDKDGSPRQIHVHKATIDVAVEDATSDTENHDNGISQAE